MLNQNRNAVYFVDVYNCFSDENKITFNRLVSKVLDKSIYSFKEVRIMLIYS